MTRRCGWCSDVAREAWESRVLHGESLVLVAADTPYSTSAAGRHMRQHARRWQLADMRTAAASRLHIDDFADRLVALADEAADVRSAAYDPRSKILAVREEREVLSVLLNKLGIESNEAIEALRESRALAVSLSMVLRDRPEVAAALSRDLADRGENELSSAFGRLAHTASVREVPSARKELVG